MSIFPDRWPVQHPDRIQLYSMPTPNGQKVSILLEELGLPYEAHRVDIREGEQLDPGFVVISPNAKIPAIIDPAGPGGEPLAIMESGAILHYLARRTGRLLPADARGENEVLQWVFFQVGSIGPMFGQLMHFSKLAEGVTDAYSLGRYSGEVRRLLGVLERRLRGRQWLVGDFSIADIAIAPWVAVLNAHGEAERVSYGDFPAVDAWIRRFSARSAVQRGRTVPG